MRTSAAKILTDLPVTVVLGRRSPWPRLRQFMAFGQDGTPFSGQGRSRPEVISFPAITNEAGSVLQPPDDCDKSLCMAGSVNTLEKCAKCGGRFLGDRKGFICPRCRTTPGRYFVDVYVPGKLLGEKRGRRIKLYSEPDGSPLDSFQRADRLLSVIRTEMEKGSFDLRRYVSQELKPLRFDNYYHAWSERRRQDLERGFITRSYLKEMIGYGRRYFLPFFGNLDIRAIKKKHLQDFIRQLPSHLSAKTTRNVMGMLHKLFQDALEREDITILPLFPQLPKREPLTRFLTVEEQEAILAHISMPVYRGLFTFCMHTGVRLGEARALKWEDVNLKEELLTIRASFDLGVYKPCTKEGDVRYLPMMPVIRELLMSLPRSLSGWVFVNSLGRPLSQRRINTVWQQAAQKAGIKITCYEATRHSFASQMIEQGVPERVVGEWLGHKTAASTRRYAKVRAEKLRSFMESSPGKVGPQYVRKMKMAKISCEDS